jgi:Holliday junction DNA helicase RuvA
MIAWLEGLLRDREPTHVIVDVRGVGYELLVSLRTFSQLPAPGKTVGLHVRTIARDDAITLFGFATPVERRTFDLLIRASRVGPKLAQTILSSAEPAVLLRALRDREISVLKRAPGVGAKLAERMALELREHAGDFLNELTLGDANGPGPETFDEVRAQLLSALLNLGYPRSQAEKVVESAAREVGPDADLEAAIRVALKMLAP